MSRELWQQRLLESVFYFFTDELKHALLGLIRSQLASSGAIDWPGIAESLRPFFVTEDSSQQIDNIFMEVYNIRLSSEGLFNDTFGTFIGAANADIAPFLKRIATIPSTDDEIAIYIKMARDFEMTLERMGDDEIALAYRQLEKELDHVNKFTRQRDGAERDKFAFFSELQSDARFAHWLQMAAWNADECIALSLGKDPKSVNSHTLKIVGMGPRLHSPFREEFKSRLEILKRAQLHGSLPELISPKEFAAWANQRQWDLPSEIEDNSTKKDNSDGHDEIGVLGTSLKTICRLLLGMAITRFEHRTTQNSSATAMIELELKDLQQLDATGPNTLSKITVGQDAIRIALSAAATHLDASWSDIIQWKGVKRPKSGT